MFLKNNGLKTRLGTILARFGPPKGLKREAFADLSWVKKGNEQRCEKRSRLGRSWGGWSNPSVVNFGPGVIRGRLGSISPLAFKAFMSCLVLLRVCLIFFLCCLVLCYVLSCAVLSCPRPCLCLVLCEFCCVVFCCASFLVNLQPAVTVNWVASPP